MSEIPKPQENETKEVTLPTETSRALGVFFNNQLRDTFAALDQAMTTLDPESEFTPDIQEDYDKVRKVFTGLRKSKKVTITPIATEYGLTISPETDETPLQSRNDPIELDRKTARAFVSGLSHVVNNPLSTVVGYPSIIGRPDISELGKKIGQVIPPLLNAEKMTITINGPQDVNVAVTKSPEPSTPTP